MSQPPTYVVSGSHARKSVAIFRTSVLATFLGTHSGKAVPSRSFSWCRITLSRIVGIEISRGALNRPLRSEEHTSELQSHSDLVCRLLLEKKKTMPYYDVV